MAFTLTTQKMVDRITETIVELEKDKSLYPKGLGDSWRKRVFGGS